MRVVVCHKAAILSRPPNNRNHLKNLEKEHSKFTEAVSLFAPYQQK
jgi:hypothetical protein